MFKHWFVDFEFPDENGNPYKSSGGEMIDSELGEIPLSWKVHKLNDIFKINYGKNLPTKKILNTGYPVLVEMVLLAITRVICMKTQKF